MSSVIIAGNTSGTITLDAPNVAGTTTLTLPATTSTLAINGPAFYAYQSSTQTITAATNIKILLQTEDWDTNSNFASSRFTPTIAGYYQVNGGINFNVNPGTFGIASVWKNGTEAARGTQGSNTGTTVSSIIYCNGTTDYLELYGYSSNANTSNTGIAYTFFNGAMIRSA